MTRINVYDYEAERIEETCENNNLTEAELIEMLLYYLEDLKRDEGLV